MRTMAVCLLLMVLVNAYMATIAFSTLIDEIETNRNPIAIQTITTQPYEGIREVRVTGYIPTGTKTAIGENVVVGRTAAISSKCLDLLGSKVYIEGHGIRHINDLTHSSIDELSDLCTVDLAVPTKEHAMKIGNDASRLVRIDRK